MMPTRKTGANGQLKLSVVKISQHRASQPNPQDCPTVTVKLLAITNNVVDFVHVSTSSHETGACDVIEATVYCGKPSKSCAPCRDKRTKCDLKQPSCGQCIRTGRLCHGYRDLSTRDQNEIARSKDGVLGTQEMFVYSATSALAQSHPLSLMEPGMATPAQTSSSIPLEIGPLVEDGAACFFFDNFIPLTYSNPSSLYDMLPQLYMQAPAGDAFASTITALGLTYLSNTLRMPKIMIDANREYAKVLKTINAAIRDPVKARNDQTLLIVMLLGLYEENNTTSRSMDSWTNHVKGALALVELRGEEQLHRPMSREILRMLRMQVVVNCLVRRSEVPESIIRWSELAQEFEDSYELLAENVLAVAIARFCNLQARIESQGKDASPEEILECALSLDVRLIQWSEKWKVTNPFEKVTATEASADLLSDHWHLYSDHIVASHWNHYRTVRIELHRIIIQQFARMATNPCSPTWYDQFEISKRTVIHLSHEICASIPYFMAKSNTTVGVSRTQQPPVQLRNTAHARLVIWPLFVVGRSPFVSGIMRLYAAEQLERIGKSMGIRKAKALGELVRVEQGALGTNWRDIGMWDR